MDANFPSKPDGPTKDGRDNDKEQPLAEIVGGDKTVILPTSATMNIITPQQINPATSITNSTRRRARPTVQGQKQPSKGKKLKSDSIINHPNGNPRRKRSLVSIQPAAWNGIPFPSQRRSVEAGNSKGVLILCPKAGPIVPASHRQHAAAPAAPPAPGQPRSCVQINQETEQSEFCRRLYALHLENLQRMQVDAQRLMQEMNQTDYFNGDIFSAGIRRIYCQARQWILERVWLLKDGVLDKEHRLQMLRNITPLETEHSVNGGGGEQAPEEDDEHARKEIQVLKQLFLNAAEKGESVMQNVERNQPTNGNKSEMETYKRLQQMEMRIEEKMKYLEEISTSMPISHASAQECKPLNYFPAMQPILGRNMGLQLGKATAPIPQLGGKSGGGKADRKGKRKVEQSSSNSIELNVAPTGWPERNRPVPAAVLCNLNAAPPMSEEFEAPGHYQAPGNNMENTKIGPSGVKKSPQ